MKEKRSPRERQTFFCNANNGKSLTKLLFSLIKGKETTPETPLEIISLCQNMRSVTQNMRSVTDELTQS